MSNRKNIYDNTPVKTKKFIEAFPSFDIWVSELTKYKVEASYINELDYIFLVSLFGDRDLFSNNLTKVYASCAIWWSSSYAAFIAKQSFYNKTSENLAEQVTDLRTGLYKIGEDSKNVLDNPKLADLTQEVVDKYISNFSDALSSVKQNYLQSLDKMNTHFSGLVDNQPLQTLYATFGNRISADFQSEDERVVIEPAPSVLTRLSVVGTNHVGYTQDTTITEDEAFVNKKYVDAIAGGTFKDNVKVKDVNWKTTTDATAAIAVNKSSIGTNTAAINGLLTSKANIALDNVTTFKGTLSTEPNNTLSTDSSGKLFSAGGGSGSTTKTTVYTYNKSINIAGKDMEIINDDTALTQTFNSKGGKGENVTVDSVFTTLDPSVFDKINGTPDAITENGTNININTSADFDSSTITLTYSDKTTQVVNVTTNNTDTPIIGNPLNIASISFDLATRALVSIPTITVTFKNLPTNDKFNWSDWTTDSSDQSILTSLKSSNSFKVSTKGETINLTAPSDKELISIKKQSGGKDWVKVADQTDFNYATDNGNYWQNKVNPNITWASSYKLNFNVSTNITIPVTKTILFDIYSSNEGNGIIQYAYFAFNPTGTKLGVMEISTDADNTSLLLSFENKADAGFNFDGGETFTLYKYE